MIFENNSCKVCSDSCHKHLITNLTFDFKRSKRKKKKKSRTVNTVHEINMFALRHLVVAVIKELKTLPFQSKEF